MPRPMVTLADVAREAGVDSSTVSRAVNGTASLSPATRTRVQRAIDKLGYQPNRAARRLAGGRTGAIGIVVPDLTNPFFSAIARGAQRAAHEAGELTFIADSDARPAEELALAAQLARDVDGLLLCSPTAPTRQLDEAVRGRPTVLVNRRARNRPSVAADQEQAVEVAYRHVQSLGHREIAYVRGPTTKWISTVREPVAERLGARLVGPFAPTVAGGAEAAAALDPRVTAVITHNDLVALGLVDALLSSGRRVPDDVSVVGCDDIEVAALVRPRLTSVAMPLDGLGRAGIAVLLQLLSPDAASDADAGAMRRTLPVRLVERDSTAVPPAPAPAPGP